MMIRSAIATLWLLASSVQSTTMNPVAYKVANSNLYHANFGNAEFFEVYSPLIRTRYSEVHWKTQDRVSLPPDIQARFENKTMAVVGYEVDQVYHAKDAGGSDVSVPITYTYNHHYNAWLLNGRKAAIFDHHHHNKSKNDDTNGMPLIQTFSSGNGGEFRGSYKGFPKGYAQLIDSPDTFQATIMQIDTWNRESMVGNNPKFVPGPLPKSAFQRYPFNATGLDFNGLVECPCSDRITKDWGMTYKIEADTCETPIETAAECWDAAQRLLQTSDPFHQYVLQPGEDAMAPVGCSLEYQENGGIHAFWNPPLNVSHSFRATTAKNVENFNDKLIAMASDQVNVTVELDATKDLATITLVGPADRWFGVAFGSHSMCIRMVSDQCPDGGPNAIIISGENITERVLDYHGAGRLIDFSFQSISTSVSGGNRTVVLTRSLQGETEDHYTFHTSTLSKPGALPIITARGCTLEYEQHCGHGPATLSFIPVDSPQKRFLSPVCRGGVLGTINGRPFTHGHHHRCEGFPLGDLVAQNNPTCNIESYVGGLMCCNHGHSLLDADQEIPWANQSLEYHMKFRFYFEEYIPSSGPAKPEGNETAPAFPQALVVGANNTTEASHQNLVSFFWMTEANAQEYDVPVCQKGTPASQCLHTITSRFQVKDMIFDCPVHPDASSCTGIGSSDSNQTKGVKLIYASAHCHASSCHSMELYNADTGRLICRVEPIVGQSDDTIFEERGYLSLPPCLWSDHDEEGLSPPELLTLNTTLLSIKRANTTFAHFGDMAMWQMRGLVVPQDDYLPSNTSSPDHQNSSDDEGQNKSNGKAPESKDTSSNPKLPHGNNGIAMLAFVFVGWTVCCMILALMVWNMAFPPSTANPDIYFPVHHREAYGDQMVGFLHSSPHEV